MKSFPLLRMNVRLEIQYRYKQTKVTSFFTWCPRGGGRLRHLAPADVVLDDVSVVRELRVTTRVLARMRAR